MSDTPQEALIAKLLELAEMAENYRQLDDNQIALVREAADRLRASLPAEHVHEFHQFEVCKHCGLTEAAILDQCHHCDENEIGARCYWCLRVWNGQSAALLTPPGEPDKR